MADNELLIREVSTGLVVTGGMTEAAGFVASKAAGEWGMGAYTGRRLAPTYDEIAQLAYSLYESRGRQDGHEIEDWLRAEQELVGPTLNCKHQRIQPINPKWSRSNKRIVL